MPTEVAGRLSGRLPADLAQRVAANFDDYHRLAQRDRRNVTRLTAELAGAELGDRTDPRAPPRRRRPRHRRARAGPAFPVRFRRRAPALDRARRRLTGPANPPSGESAIVGRAAAGRRRCRPSRSTTAARSPATARARPAHPPAPAGGGPGAAAPRPPARPAPAAREARHCGCLTTASATASPNVIACPPPATSATASLSSSTSGRASAPRWISATTCSVTSRPCWVAIAPAPPHPALGEGELNALEDRQPRLLRQPATILVVDRLTGD